MDSDAKSILRLIEKHSGEWTWYQLARTNVGTDLAIKGTRLPDVLNSLTASKFIEEVENDPSPKFLITDIGRAALAEDK
jgi:hypothetical protein